MLCVSSGGDIGGRCPGKANIAFGDSDRFGEEGDRCVCASAWPSSGKGDVNEPGLIELRRLCAGLGDLA